MTIVKIDSNRYFNLANASDIKAVYPNLVRVYWNFSVTGGYEDAMQTAYDEITGQPAMNLIAWLDRNAADATAPQPSPEPQPKHDPLADLRAAAHVAGTMARDYGLSRHHVLPPLSIDEIQAIGPPRGLYRTALSRCDLDHTDETAAAYIESYNAGLEGA